MRSARSRSARLDVGGARACDGRSAAAARRGHGHRGNRWSRPTGRHDLGGTSGGAAYPAGGSVTRAETIPHSVLALFDIDGRLTDTKTIDDECYCVAVGEALGLTPAK